MTETCGAPQADAAAASRTDVVVLRFPNNCYAQLLNFGRELKQRFARCGVDHDPFLLEVMHGPPPRLWIDNGAFVECDDVLSQYRVIVQASDATRIVVETSDFSRIDTFVGHYIVDKITQGTSGMATP